MPARQIERVLSTMALTDAQKARIEQMFHPAPVTFVHRRDKPSIKRALEQVDVAVVAGNPPAILLDAPHLRWVHCDQAGLERFATPRLFQSDLLVTSAAGRSAPALAEHVMFFMLALAYRSRTLDRMQRRRVWGARGQQVQRGLLGRSVLIVGLGHAGREIARRCLAFGMDVAAYRRKDRPTPVQGLSVYSSEAGSRLDDLLPQANFLVLAASLNNTSHRMIGADQLDQLANGSFLINVARARLVDTPAMLAALRSGRLAGAGIDVAEQEPLPPWSRLWGAPNLILTPHFTPQGEDRTARSMSILEQNIQCYRSGKDLYNQVMPDDGFDHGHQALPRHLALMAKAWRVLARPGRMPDPDLL